MTQPFTPNLSSRTDEVIVIYKYAAHLRDMIASFTDRNADCGIKMFKQQCNDLDNTAGDLLATLETFLGENIKADQSL